MTRKPFRLMRALLGAGCTGARAASGLASGGLAWLTPLLLGPACALALDIGEIQVHPALNQLFDARIPLPALAPPLAPPLPAPRAAALNSSATLSPGSLMRLSPNVTGLEHTQVLACQACA